MLYCCMLTLKYLYIFMLYLCFTPASPLFTYVTAVILFPVLLKYIHLYSCFTRTLLVLFLLCMCVCVCVPAYWPSLVCAAQ